MIGKFHYWWYGGGNRKQLKNALKDYKKLSTQRELTEGERNAYREAMDQSLENNYIDLRQYQTHELHEQGARIKVK